MANFPCIKCGLCCRNVRAFGLPERPDGACLFLNQDNTCQRYDSRPPICRVNDYDVEANVAACNHMLAAAGDPRRLLMPVIELELPGVTAPSTVPGVALDDMVDSYSEGVAVAAKALADAIDDDIVASYLEVPSGEVTSSEEAWPSERQ